MGGDCLALLLAVSSVGAAVVAPPSSPALVSAAAPPVASACPAAPVIPALTPVVLAITEPVGSTISKTGQTFAISLQAPILIGTREVVPAGTTGMGEVVWAKKAGGSGAPGELVLAARYLEFGGRRIRLRSLDFHAVGDSKYKTVNGIMIGSAAAMPLASVVGFAIKGKETAWPAGTVAGAKTAEAFAIVESPPSSTDNTKEENACVQP